MNVSIPEYALFPYSLAELVAYAALLCGIWLSWRVVRAYERRCAEPERLRVLAERLALLEVTVAQVETNVERTAEVQRFTTALLAGRVRGARQSEELRKEER